MPLWLALFLPALPLQLAERALEQSRPLAIVAGPAQRPVVAYCNDCARAAGIRPGQKLAAAQAFARDLIALPQQLAIEHDALHELACWAYQFSSLVVAPGTTSSHKYSHSHSHTSHQSDDSHDAAHVTQGLLIETGGSARLFESHARLHQRIGRELAALGYTAAFGCAITPRAAWLLAQARAHGLDAPSAFDAGQLRRALAPLPLALTGWDSETLATLDALGLATLGDLLALPRAAVNQRFGTELLADLDRALGLRPDPQSAFEPPARFASRIELPADVTEAAQLMFPAHRLLRSLEGFLRGRNAGATELVFSARHNSRRTVAIAPTRFALSLAIPERDARRLAQLLNERLTRLALPEPAIELALTVAQLHPFTAANGALLPPAPGATAGAGVVQLAEVLHARLGTERVFQLRSVDDHRPEFAWRRTPVAIETAMAETGASRQGVSKAHKSTDSSAGTPASDAAINESASSNMQTTAGSLLAAPRPLLLLAQPRPLATRAEHPDDGNPLTLVAGPERIESGWWDFGAAPRAAVHRDYFVARNNHGQMLWIYRELALPRGWYLHGLFA